MLSQVSFSLSGLFRSKPRWLMVKWGSLFLFKDHKTLIECHTKNWNQCDAACSRRVDLGKVMSLEFLLFEQRKQDLLAINLKLLDSDCFIGTRGDPQRHEHLVTLACIILNSLPSKGDNSQTQHSWNKLSKGLVCYPEGFRGDTHSQRTEVRTSDNELKEYLGLCITRQARNRVVYYKII